MEFEYFYDEQSYIMGTGLEQFEAEYAAFSEVKYAVGVGNGHDALLIILKCLGIGPGDEVIVPAHTFIATALSVIHAGAKPVFVDIDRNTLNIQTDKIESKITKNTKAIVPVHLYGNPCDMEKIMSLGKNYKIDVIEDNAQAQGAEYHNQKTGSLGVMNFTSFYPTKNLGALGDAGMITTNVTELNDKANTFRNYGKSVNGDYTLIGMNSRMDELQARLLRIKLKYLSKWNMDRIAIAELYENQLKGLDEIQFQSPNQGCTNVRHIFPILTEKRNALKTYLDAKGIETLIHYEKPIHLHKAFTFLNYKKSDFPIAVKVCDTELSLPIYPGIEVKEVIYVCDCVISFFSKN